MHALLGLWPQAFMAHSLDVLAFFAGHDQHCATNQVDSTRIRYPTTSQPKRFHQREHSQLDLRYAKCPVSEPRWRSLCGSASC